MSTETIVRVAPTVEPLTLTEAKAQLRIEPAFTLDDDYINSLISMARDRAENYCNRFFTEQQITILYDGVMPLVIDLQYPGLASVESLQYPDGDLVLQTVSAGDYVVDLDRQRITITGNVETGIDYRVNATTAAPVEFKGARAGMLMMLADMFDLRTESVVGVSVTDNPAVLAALYPYRVKLGI